MKFQEITLGVLGEKVLLRISQNSRENNCARASFKKDLSQLYKKNPLAQVFSSEFCEIFKSTSFAEHLRMTASQ